MGRRRKGLRILGPYRKGNRYQLITITPGGIRKAESYATRREAEARLNAERKVMGIGGLIGDALDQYEQMKRLDHQISEYSIGRERGRIAHYIDECAPLDSLRAAPIRKIMKARLASFKKITVKKEVESVKSFARFVARRFPAELSRTRLSEILELGTEIRLRKGESRRKPQLTFDEATRFVDQAFEIGGEEGCAVLCALLLGMRGKEILELRGRDVDQGGAILHIRGTKTAGSYRSIVVYDPRMRELLASMVEDPADYLFPSERSSIGRRCHNWLRAVIRRIGQLAGTSLVPPHGLRGSLTTRLIGLGLDPALVSDFQGNSPTVALGHYAQPGSQDSGAARRAQLRVINGG